MRSLCAAFVASLAAAEQPTGMPEGPAPERYEIVGKRSPEFTQDRTLPGTRFWLLDPGNKEVQFWYRPKVDRGAHDTSHLLQAEIEIGVLPHLQLDLYQNVVKEPGADWKHEGNQIEARISFADYGEIWANPVLYLEWHPRDDDDKYEVRVLLGGEVARGVLVAVNPFWEHDVQGAQTWEWGGTAGLSAAIARDAVHLGLEFKAAFERAEGAGETEQAYLLGPNVFAKVLDDRLKLMATFFMGLNEGARLFEPIFIVGSEL